MRYFITGLFLSFLLSVAAAEELPAGTSESLPAELTHAWSLYDNGQLLEAYALFKEYYTQNPSNMEATFLLALCKWKMMWLSTYTSEDKKEVTDLLEKVQAICEPVMNKDLSAQFYYAASIGVQA